MGAAKENRDRAAAARVFEDEGNEPCGYSRRQYSEYVTMVENKILTLEHKLGGISGELKDLKVFSEKQTVYITAHKFRIKELNRSLEVSDKSRKGVFSALLRSRRAHYKLSAIVRRVMTPESYHLARKQESNLRQSNKQQMSAGNPNPPIFTTANETTKQE